MNTFKKRIIGLQVEGGVILVFISAMFSMRQYPHPHLHQGNICHPNEDVGVLTHEKLSTYSYQISPPSCPLHLRQQLNPLPPLHSDLLRLYLLDFLVYHSWTLSGRQVGRNCSYTVFQHTVLFEIFVEDLGPARLYFLHIPPQPRPLASVQYINTVMRISFCRSPAGFWPVLKYM